MGNSLDEIAGQRIVNGYMIRSIIRPEMILHRFIGMRNGNIRQIRISAILCRPKQHFQIYHIIHDCVVSAKQLYIAGPWQHCAYLRFEQCGQCIRRIQNHLFVSRILGQAVTISVATEHEEAQVMVECGGSGKELQWRGKFLRFLFYPLVTAIFVIIPQHTGPKTSAPLFFRCLTAVPIALTVQYIAGHHSVIRHTIRIMQPI